MHIEYYDVCTLYNTKLKYKILHAIQICWTVAVESHYSSVIFICTIYTRVYSQPSWMKLVSKCLINRKSNKLKIKVNKWRSIPLYKHVLMCFVVLNDDLVSAYLLLLVQWENALLYHYALWPTHNRAIYFFFSIYIKVKVIFSFFVPSVPTIWVLKCNKYITDEEIN